VNCSSPCVLDHGWLASGRSALTTVRGLSILTRSIDKAAIADSCIPSLRWSIERTLRKALASASRGPISPGGISSVPAQPALSRVSNR